METTYLHKLEIHLILLYGRWEWTKAGRAELDLGLVLFQDRLALKWQPDMELLIVIPHVQAKEFGWIDNLPSNTAQNESEYADSCCYPECKQASATA